jgi:hypothetical protein
MKIKVNMRANIVIVVNNHKIEQVNSFNYLGYNYNNIQQRFGIKHEQILRNVEYS